MIWLHVHPVDSLIWFARSFMYTTPFICVPPCTFSHVSLWNAPAFALLPLKFLCVPPATSCFPQGFPIVPVPPSTMAVHSLTLCSLTPASLHLLLIGLEKNQVRGTLSMIKVLVIRVSAGTHHYEQWGLIKNWATLYIMSPSLRQRLKG